MQENVKVFTPEVLVEVFGDVSVRGDFNYKLRIDYINSRELAELARINEEYGMNFHIRRSGKRLIIYSPPAPVSEVTESPKFTYKTVRDFYEFMLPDDARKAAFDNTSKAKLDNPAGSLCEALSQSFYFSDTPQGANYWQDIIVENQ